MDARRLLIVLSVSSCLLITTTTSFALPTSRKETHIELTNANFISASPFSASLLTLQKQIGYNINRINLLRRAMTHASYSGENNKALSILGSKVPEASVSLRAVEKNIEITPKELNTKIKVVSEVNSCSEDGLRLGLDKIVRVSPKMNSSNPAIVCGAFRSIFGAIVVDTGRTDDAGDVFWNVTHHGGRAYAI